MKIDEMARGGLLTLGVLGLAAGAALGFAAGMAVARDPEALRRTARRAARGLEAASLLAAQAREHVGDLWAEAREAARTEVDAQDFERAAAAAGSGAEQTAAARQPARKATPGPARKSAPKPKPATAAAAGRAAASQTDSGGATPAPTRARKARHATASPVKAAMPPAAEG